MNSTHRVRMYTTTSCSDCRRAKRFLESRHVPYEEVNIEETPGAAEIVLQANQGRRAVPTFEFAGRFFSCSPFDPEILLRELDLPSA